MDKVYEIRVTIQTADETRIADLEDAVGDAVCKFYGGHKECVTPSDDCDYLVHPHSTCPVFWVSGVELKEDADTSP